MTYKVLSSLTANNVNSADILKVKTDLLIIGVNKKTSSASELKDLKSSSNSMIGESMNEINKGTRKSIFLPAPAKVGAKNILLITSDTYSKFIEKKNYKNRIIFGDGSSASIISKKKKGLAYKINKFEYGTDGSVGKNAILKNFDTNYLNKFVKENKDDV